MDRIIDHHGNELTTDGARGEIIVRGPGVMLGYLGNPEATRDMIRNGWLHTGDVGYSLGGKWYIVDRIKVG
jgi:long-subunit acyl-CoA synthetase (AMP-forming)